MGNSQGIFERDELEKYQKVTYLNTEEIFKCFDIFTKIVNSGRRHKVKKIDVRSQHITKEQFLKSDQFKYNPFNSEIFDAFTTEEEMSFNDFLNMMSVFSESCDLKLKAQFAFKIYGKGKAYLEREDIIDLIKKLTGTNELRTISEDYNILIDKIFKEADINDDKKIDYGEFEIIALKSYDFKNSNYGKKMAQLSARIFGQLLIDKNTPNGRLIQRLSQKPIEKMNEYSMNYYPRHQEHDHLFKVLRYHGLFRDEHRDFVEEIERLKKLRGKGKRERKPQTEDGKK